MSTLVDRGRNSAALAVSVGRVTYERWREDRAIRLGAGLAYYGLFGIPPLLTLAAAAVGSVFSRVDAEKWLADRLALILEGEADAVAAKLFDQLSESGTQLGLGLVGVVSVLLAASLLVLALQDALNVIWGAPVRAGLATSIKRRVLSFGVVLMTIVMLLASLVVQAVVGLAESLVPDALDGGGSLGILFSSAASWILGVAAITLLFRVLPYEKVSWRAAIIGGAATAVLVVIGTAAIGAYVGRFATTSFTGAAAAIVLVLFWVYYEAQILLVGAELTRVLHERRAGDAPAAV